MEASTSQRPVEIALAVLLVRGRYALQLRDDKPGISSPGMWGFFGGRLEPGELPEAAMRRELAEELAIHPHRMRFLWTSERDHDVYSAGAKYWMFEVDASDCWHEHRVLEGRGANMFARDRIDSLHTPDYVKETIRRYHDERGADHSV